MRYKSYSLSEFKKNTRKILNEALISPVEIRRYSDRFILKNAASIDKKDKNSV